MDRLLHRVVAPISSGILVFAGSRTEVLPKMQAARKLQVLKVLGRGKPLCRRFSSSQNVSPCQLLNARNHRPDSLNPLSRVTGSVDGNHFRQPYSVTHTGKAADGNLPTVKASLAERQPSRVSIPLDGESVEFSAVLLRDACSCPACVHESTRQRLFSTADIPTDVHAQAVEVDALSEYASITWENDVPGHSKEHVTKLSMAALRNIVQSGQAPGSHQDSFLPPVLWSQEPLNLPDYDYDAYMKDDRTLYQLISQLRTEGLAFVTNIPGLEESLATIATRIGPIKDTFYGQTWDVRTVPAAINAAYTSHDLGFHTDLLYFEQPPHIQLLHCIQSASSGGASVFADAFKAAVDLFHSDTDAFNTLATVPVNYHYNHPDSNVYHTTKPVIDLIPLRIGDTVYTQFRDYLNAMECRHAGDAGVGWQTAALVESLQKINWGPPFLAPFSNHESPTDSGNSALSALNSKADEWHRAASKFNALLQRPEYLYERKMNPGECVLFDNTRTLHSRRAFNMADVGMPRWLRGTYVDKDPYLSKLRVLQSQFP